MDRTPPLARRGGKREGKPSQLATKSAPSISHTAAPSISLSAPQSAPISVPTSTQQHAQRGFLLRASSSAINYNTVQPFEPFYGFSIRLIGVGFLLYAFCFLSVTLGGERVSTCNFSPYRRGENPDALHQAVISIGIRQFLFFWGIRLVFLAFFFVLYRLSERKLALLIAYGIIVVGYTIGFFTVEFLKAISGDTECHGRSPNGISGHFYYISWALFIVMYLGRVVRRKQSDAVTQLLESAATFFAILCLLIDGFYTYWYGYHSLKQIFYGAIFGTLYASLMIYALERLFLWEYENLTKSRIVSEAKKLL